MISGLGALDALSGPQRFGGATGPLAAAQPSVSASDFSSAVAEAANRTIHTLSQAESVSMTALEGGNVQARDVVDAVMSAEQTLQAAISIRDKIVTAYLEVSRMAI
ncbi:flagellar hook-basal body complex protein FliE [Aquibium carbonis]|uniref:Flagellar hook-basal body complex protein FliE n=1 Tax=Aquibium carbonis TaxID=2495581 RepID=A0A429YWM2_9HYPH|nr:flagellar hook-basal body complex protein FliE [Aquibium carbonis]RST85856.1 flagellar hook-basal body complex protein FliE [Aquibium carbonis]